MPIVRAETLGDVPRRRWLAAVFFRTLFILGVAVTAFWASLPVDRSFAGLVTLPLPDALRVAIGTAVCLGALISAFRLPKDAKAYEVWVQIGGALCLFAVFVSLIFLLIRQGR